MNFDYNEENEEVNATDDFDVRNVEVRVNEFSLGCKGIKYG